MKWIDLPPIWLVGHLMLSWLARGVPAMFDAPVWDVVGVVFSVAGGVLMVWAVGVMMRARTTVIPHMAPDALVTSGPFRLSRNPIYLGDGLVLLGLSLVWGSPLGVLLVPVFGWIITRRFIEPEEARLRAAFGGAFAVWSGRVRRWI